jgi:DNA mismatch endonuclease (patch repair protein)
MPRTRIEYWSAKFDRTAARDAAATAAFENLGWRVLVLWECRLRNTAWLEHELLAVTAPGRPSR